MADASITNLRDTTSVDRETGAVCSIQTADLLLSEEQLAELWSPIYLERLARTYWRFLTRVTLGLVRVRYTERERFVVLLFKPLKLLTFKAPEYLLEPDHGIVRWRIERGLLVARAGRGGDGHLQIDVRRAPGPPARGVPDPAARHVPDPAARHVPDPAARHVPDAAAARARLHVEVEVANFYPAISLGISRWLYNVTQSRIHVLITHGFLRSLARLNLAPSRTRRFER